MSTRKKMLVKVEAAEPDPSDYKSMSPRFVFEDTYVEVDVSNEMRGDSIVLKPASFSELLSQLAVITADGFDNYKKARKS